MNLGSRSGGIKSFGNFGPVHNLPNFLHKVWSHVLVVDIIGVLPNIDGQERHQVSALVSKSILVSCGSELKISTGFVVSQPSPSGPLNSSGVGAEVSNELFSRSESMTDSLIQR